MTKKSTEIPSPTIKPTEKTTDTPTFTPTITEKPTPKPIEKLQETYTPKPTEKPTAQPTVTLTPIPATLEPTQTPSYTVISGSIRNGVLQGNSEVRDEEGNPTAQLDSGLNSQAEVHAIKMAKADKLFHSSMDMLFQ